MAKEKIMWVRAVKGIDFNGRVGENQVLLYEQDSRHPTGEAFIAGPIPVQVADTAAVSRLLKDGDIEEVSATEAKKAGGATDPAAVAQAELTQKQEALAARADALDAREQALDAEAKRLEALAKK